MAGMNTLGSAGISDYQTRTVTIEVAGICQQSVLKTGSYTVRVPYSQMSQAMQSINRQGGKVTSVQLMGNPPAVAEGDRDQAAADVEAPEAKPTKKDNASLGVGASAFNVRL